VALNTITPLNINKSEEINGVTESKTNTSIKNNNNKKKSEGKKINSC